MAAALDVVGQFRLHLEPQNPAVFCEQFGHVWAKFDAQTTQATQPNLNPNEIPILGKMKNWICQIVAPMKDIMSANTRDECAMTQRNLSPIQTKIPILHPTCSSLALDFFLNFDSPVFFFNPIIKYHRLNGLCKSDLQ